METPIETELGTEVSFQTAPKKTVRLVSEPHFITARFAHPPPRPAAVLPHGLLPPATASLRTVAAKQQLFVRALRAVWTLPTDGLIVRTCRCLAPFARNQLVK